jgi:hypothetical protein
MIHAVVSSLREAMLKKGYTFFGNGDYNLNLIGVRADTNKPGAFDDAMFCVYKVKGVWRAHLWPITTDPGTHYLREPINVAGTAILVPGQYRGAYVIGDHKGYPALVQHGGPVRVWRDSNRDEILDWGPDPGIGGWYGINLHRSKPKGITNKTDYASAGCQVFALREEHDALMDLARRSAKLYGPQFSYTLLEARDL